MPGPDGRTLRRERNVTAARNATLELLAEGVQPSLAEIAERAGVATRSVYRYFGDADNAIQDAVKSRADRALEVFKSEPVITESMPFDERLAMLILRRLRLERLAAPLDGSVVDVVSASAGFDYPVALDDEVRSAFGPELAARRSDAQLDRLLCAMFRIRAIRSMRRSFDDSEEQVASALSRLVAALLVHADANPVR